MTWVRARPPPWATLGARWALAAVWAYAALSKLGDPDAAVRAVRAYQAVPEALVESLAWGLPFVELALTAMLLTGVVPRVAAWASLGILAVFVAGIVSVWVRGLQIDCGCFGGGGPAEVDDLDYALELARDLGLAALALVVARGSPDRWQLRRHLPEGLRTTRGQAALGLVVLGGAAGLGVAVQGQRSAQEAERVVAPSTVADDRTIEGTPWVVGRPDAPVVVEIYEDLDCTHCQVLHVDIEPALDPFVDDGVVRVAYHPMPLTGDDGVRGAAAMACAHDAGALPEYRDAAFALAATGADLTSAQLVALGQDAGIEDAAFADCVRDGTYEPWVRGRLDAGSERGVVLTPTVFVDGELVPAPVTTASLTEVIEAGSPGGIEGLSPGPR